MCCVVVSADFCVQPVVHSINICGLCDVILRALRSVRRLRHNTCIPQPAVRGLGGLGGREPQPGPCYTFVWPSYAHDSDVMCRESVDEGDKGEKEGGGGVVGLSAGESNK